MRDFCSRDGVLRLADGPADCARAVREQLRRNARLSRSARPGIIAALEAGARTIEHGTYLDEECCDAMRETGAVLVPTRTIVEDILANLAAVPEYAATKLVAIADVHAGAVALALQRGVTIAMGTDIGLTGSDLPNSWGKNVFLVTFAQVRWGMKIIGQRIRALLVNERSTSYGCRSALTLANAINP